MIGLCGVARSGKDTLCEAMIRVLSNYNIRGKRFAIADELKKQLSPFIMDQFGIDIYKCTDEEKTLVRPLMLEWGLIHRNRTKGKYLTNILQIDIDIDLGRNITTQLNPLNMEYYDKLSRFDIPIVTDIRYNEFEEDEVHWVKEVNNGVLVHIQKYIDGALLLPPNTVEERNDPLLQRDANYRLVWDQMTDTHLGEITVNHMDYYYDKAEEVLKALDII